MERKLKRGFVLTVGCEPISGLHAPVLKGDSKRRAYERQHVSSLPERCLDRPLSLEVSERGAVVARDLLGTAPVYYRAMKGGGWVCSDDLDILRSIEPKVTELDRDCLASYALSLQLLDASERTVWKGISRILPGRRVKFLPGRVLHLAKTDVSFDSGGLTPQRLISGLRAELYGEVAPLALSRGTDSTLLAMLMSGHHGVSAVTMSFPSFSRIDESGGSSRIAELLGLPYSPLSLEPEHTDVFQDAFIEAVPVLHSGISHEALFFRWLSDLGHDAVTTGVGADQLCYTPFYWVLRQLLSSGKFEALRWRSQTSRSNFCKEAAVVWSRAADVFSFTHSRAKRQIDTVMPGWRHPGFEVSDDMLEHVSFMSRCSRSPGENYLKHMIASHQWESMMQARRVLSEKSTIQIKMPFLSESLWRAALDSPSWQLAGFSDACEGGPVDKLPIRRAHDLLGLLPRQVAWRGKVATFDAFVRAAIFLPRHQKLIRDLVNGMVLDRLGIVDEKKFQTVVWRLIETEDMLPPAGISRVWSTLFTEYWVRRMGAGS